MIIVKPLLMVKLPQPVGAYNSHKENEIYSSILLFSTRVPCDWLTVLPTFNCSVLLCPLWSHSNSYFLLKFKVFHWAAFIHNHVDLRMQRASESQGTIFSEPFSVAIPAMCLPAVANSELALFQNERGWACSCTKSSLFPFLPQLCGLWAMWNLCVSSLYTCACSTFCDCRSECVAVFFSKAKSEVNKYFSPASSISGKGFALFYFCIYCLFSVES